MLEDKLRLSPQAPEITTQAEAWPSFKVLGVRVHAVQISDVVGQINDWIENRNGSHYIAVTGMHGVTEAQHDEGLRRVLNSADLVVPDGMPLVWLGRLRRYRLKRRVYGPELMLTFCEQTKEKAYRHFFYGGAPGVAQELSDRLLQNYPSLNVVGCYSPPFRPLTEQEEAEIAGVIRRAAPDVLWVGLSTPKQERWMYEHREKLAVPAMVGVGAAFDLNTGRVKQAPFWMREHGLEWLWRLVQEPRRLWRRYLVRGPEFILYIALEFLGARKSRSQ